MMIRSAYIIILGLALACVSGCAKKAEFELSNLVVRETPPGAKTGVAYLSIQNNSRDSLVLNYVHSPRAGEVEVHRHLYQDGMMKMREVKHLSIDPHQHLDFTPGGYHLMLFDLVDRFEEGQQVELTFEFENNAPMTVVADVRRL